MSGIVGALASLSTGKIIVTLGDHPSQQIVGYQNNYPPDSGVNYGTASPPYYLGRPILALNSFNQGGGAGAVRFRLTLEGTGLTQSFFTSLIVETGSGGILTLTSANSQFLDNTTYFVWQWRITDHLPDPTDPPWVDADIGERRSVRIFR